MCLSIRPSKECEFVGLVHPFIVSLPPLIHIHRNSLSFLSIPIFQAISLMTSNQECVNDIAASDVLVYLLLALHTLPAGIYLTFFCRLEKWVDLKKNCCSFLDTDSLSDFLENICVSDFYPSSTRGSKDITVVWTLRGSEGIYNLYRWSQVADLTTSLTPTRRAGHE